ncbi:PAS domain-containing sensor histidine kinase [Mucilaginibacter sp. AK015]|uniref:PAS domain-containing sensor histidine kinase n=1 Tax=Mucilaginibacter sp. AK015 TaxID=2723072 RepID=UPI001608E608|nr:PAS domain-containing sensor histidine kinase [Mucilaginibacter sp. AK015]MBB5394763.1 two-component system sensor histidine kinase VicK [Mucilaginibacter sp. AK015]
MESTVFHDLTEKSSVASFVFNINTGKFIYANPAFASLVGANYDELTPNHLSEIIHPEDRVYAQKALADVLGHTLANYVQLRILVNKEIKWVRITASQDKDKTGDMLLYGNVADITSELQNQLGFEKYANKKDAILNILAHDLAGPLSVINMLGSSLRSSIHDPADITQIDNIIKINTQAIALIREFTAREFLETADITLAKKRVNIAQKVREYVEEYQKSITDIKRTFNFFTSAENIFINVDEPKFFQILNNLTTNALKFTSDNGVITVSVIDKGDVVQFSVKDDGIGIPEKYRDILFDKFTDASRKGLQGEPTIGLGMYVIKNIIDWHNGTLWVNSTENKGTTIFFELPKI